MTNTDKTWNYPPITHSMLPQDFFKIVKKYSTDPNFPYKDECVKYILRSPDMAMFALWWAKNVKYDMDTIFNYILENGSPYDHIDWCISIDYPDNYKIKIKFIEYNQIGKFIYNVRSVTGNKEYNLSDFYNDLPTHYQLGIII